MRRKKEAVLCFASNDDGLPKVVRDYRARYRAISQVLDRNPEILDAVHQMTRWSVPRRASSRSGRPRTHWF